MEKPSQQSFFRALSILPLLLLAALFFYLHYSFVRRSEWAALRDSLLQSVNGRQELARQVAALTRQMAVCLNRLQILEGKLEAGRQPPPGPAEAPAPEPQASPAEVAALRKQVARLQSEVEALQAALQAGQVPDPVSAAVIENLQKSSQEPPVTSTGSNPGAVQWSIDQLLGEPDTLTDGDAVTAWASRKADAGMEWVEVEFAKAAVPTAVLVRETFNPGAVVQVEAADAGGAFHTFWEGEDPTTVSPGDLVIRAPAGAFPTRRIKVHIDCAKVPGWNEIDAIGLISGNRTQWAVAAKASSSYSSVYDKNENN